MKQRTNAAGAFKQGCLALLEGVDERSQKLDLIRWNQVTSDETMCQKMSAPGSIGDIVPTCACVPRYMHMFASASDALESWHAAATPDP